MAKDLYLFSGLGADEKVFQNLDFTGFAITFIKWIVPYDKETIEGYAYRLLEQITTTKPILIGLSFGGIMAIEISKLIDTEKVVLISSAKTKEEIPFYFRLAGKIGLHKIISATLFQRSNFITNWFFGTETIKEKRVLKQVLKETNPIFSKWAIGQVACWKNSTIVDNVFHIHGIHDKILPYAFIKCDVPIKMGGHFMILNKAQEINIILRQQL